MGDTIGKKLQKDRQEIVMDKHVCLTLLHMLLNLIEM
jgi:hypothetical protein